VKGSDRRRLGGVIQTQDIGLLGEMKVREVSLMKSDLSPAGAKYARLDVVKLEG
jgi:2'-5' RNA ligase